MRVTSNDCVYNLKMKLSVSSKSGGGQMIDKPSTVPLKTKK